MRTFFTNTDGNLGLVLDSVWESLTLGMVVNHNVLMILLIFQEMLVTDKNLISGERSPTSTKEVDFRRRATG